jgi:PKD repeat protein/N-acetyl-anhydromuramyl-L-alanine amidase AmpD
MSKYLSILLFLLVFSVQAESTPNNYQVLFNSAYNEYPNIPKGILEGVSFTQTHFKHISNPEPGCIGLPTVSGPMGLTEDGQGYFRNNLKLVSNLSGFSISEIKQYPLTNIFAYASAYSKLVDSLNLSTNINEHDVVLKILSEIPWDHNSANDFALNSFVYQVFSFVKSINNQHDYNIPDHSVNLVDIFGVNNYNVLTGKTITIKKSKVIGENNLIYIPQNKSAEYTPASWVPTPACNFSSRNGTPISAVTIHTIQGTYSGAISWAQNCAANVSYHYVERSSDGQVTQMLLEVDKGWHVGSENPYTIGIEHEGYVNDASWYTQSMYQSSADLVRDITNSGYGINPLRTFFGIATSGTNLLGGCTKIKGHQHYPGQNHTDPGANWDWEKYYKLINNTPNITTTTSASGVSYDSGGSGGNYADDERELYLIEPVGATSITLAFSVFDLENNWDYMYIYDGNNTDDQLLGVFTGNANPNTISSSGGSILLEFRSDCGTTAEGWEVNWTSIIDPVAGDVISPITSVNLPASWNTTNFTATFTDNDNNGGAGVKYKLFQPIDYNGIEWRANSNNGFFSDNFDLNIHTDWSQQAAVWSINNGFLQCNDEAESNTNIYTSLNQNNETIYLYHWSGKISGSGNNKRAGLHFMCSDPTLDQRGDSYMVYFRTDNNKIQIYEAVNNTIVLEQDISYTINDNQWYDFKIMYNKSIGEISVFVDNSLEASWIDNTPLTSGNAISFRSGNCIYDLNNMKVYHDRTNSELITIGVGNDLEYQNQNSVSPAGRVKSIIIDSAYNISAITFEDVNIDWTNPDNLSYVNDGIGSDIFTFTNNNTISANWNTSLDTNSDIAAYWYSIGTTSGATDVLNWTDNWFDTTMTHSGLNLVVGTIYYVSVKAQNGAGLFSNIFTSNGQQLQTPTNAPVANFTVLNSFVCSTDSLLFTNNSTDAVSYLWSVPGAIPPTSTDINPYFSFPSSGNYTITLNVTGPGGTDSEVQNINIEVTLPTSSVFTASDNIVDITFPNLTFTNTSINANGYFWDFGDGTVSTDENPWHSYNGVGTYQVMCVAINGVCPNDTSWTTIDVVDGVGLNKISTELIHIYPNPASNIINIVSTHKIKLIQIIDSRGRIISPYSVSENNEIINVSNLESGLYFLKITNNNSLFYKELIIK